MKFFYVSLMAVFCWSNLLAQQDGLLSQYMFNGLAINPAYAGSHEALSLNFLYRNQAIGVDGAPSTITFAAHTPLKNKKIALGLLFARDQFGVTNQNTITAVYAYRIEINESTLSFGLQAGINSYKVEYSKLLISQPGDPSFQDEDVKETDPSFGAGAYLTGRSYYVGISAPQLLNSTINDSDISRLNSFILTGGYVFPINKWLLFKPNLLMRLTDGRAVELNINGNLLIDEVLWIGASYRPNNALAALLEVQLTDQIRIGYSYDISINEFGEANKGSHEILINYVFRFSRDGLVSPRLF